MGMGMDKKAGKGEKDTISDIDEPINLARLVALSPLYPRSPGIMLERR